MVHITSNRAGGVVARKIIPAVLLFPIVLDGVLLISEWRKLFGSDIGTAVFTVGIIVLFL